jgi:hypothetical protein
MMDKFIDFEMKPVVWRTKKKSWVTAVSSGNVLMGAVGGIKGLL